MMDDLNSLIRIRKLFNTIFNILEFINSHQKLEIYVNQTYKYFLIVFLYLDSKTSHFAGLNFCLANDYLLNYALYKLQCHPIFLN